MSFKICLRVTKQLHLMLLSQKLVTWGTFYESPPSGIKSKQRRKKRHKIIGKNVLYFGIPSSPRPEIMGTSKHDDETLPYRETRPVVVCVFEETLRLYQIPYTGVEPTAEVNS